MVSIICLGKWKLTTSVASLDRKMTVSVLQGNITTRPHGASIVSVIGEYTKLCLASPPGLCLWAEWSFPFNIRRFHFLKGFLDQARQYKQDWIMGVIDTDKGALYNSACAISSEGRLLPEIYHKRYLVPIGEYIPWWIQISPLAFLFGTCTPLSDGFSSGSDAVVYQFDQARIAPVICFESLSPEIVASSVRKGGEILVNLSNTAWFRSSMIGDQMVSFCVLRAAETHRSFAFATAIGPSVMVDPQGKILRISARNEKVLMTEPMPVESDLTPFARFCR